MRILAENLVKQYKGRKVVDNVSFDLNQGEIVGLLGPNGAGKTTTFYMVTGLVKPNQGTVLFDDVAVTSWPMYRRARAGVGYLPQETSVFKKLSVIMKNDTEEIKRVMEVISGRVKKKKVGKLLEEIFQQTNGTPAQEPTGRKQASMKPNAQANQGTEEAGAATAL